MSVTGCTYPWSHGPSRVFVRNYGDQELQATIVNFITSMRKKELDCSPQQRKDPYTRLPSTRVRLVSSSRPQPTLRHTVMTQQLKMRTDTKVPPSALSTKTAFGCSANANALLGFRFRLLPSPPPGGHPLSACWCFVKDSTGMLQLQRLQRPLRTRDYCRPSEFRGLYAQNKCKSTVSKHRTTNLL